MPLSKSQTEVRHKFAAEHHADQQGEAERRQDLTGDDQSVGDHRRNRLKEPANRRRAEQDGEKPAEIRLKIEQRRTAEVHQADHPGITLRRIAVRQMTEAGVHHAYQNAQRLRQH